ncbi:hypothetical protein [Massilia suwonensis]|uniref:Lipoprotein n=1 Tax=Massilia suwonensis TaxID=648895 RepID=A0ABW0MQZ3_9BURK
MRQLAILILLACTACATRADGPSSTPAPAPAEASAPAASGTLGQIQALIGKAECSSDSQCQVLPIGAKACGGPASHLAYSTAKTDAGALQALAERYKTEQQAGNQRSGRMSNCMVLPTPTASCRANTCQLGEAAAAVR